MASEIILIVKCSSHSVLVLVKDLLPPFTFAVVILKEVTPKTHKIDNRFI